MKKFFSKKILALLIAPTILLSLTSMPERASFTGEWKLNEGKSELGDFGARIAPRLLKVEQKEDGISVARTAPSFDGGEATTNEALTFNGKESESTLFGNSKKKSVAKWSEDGQTLTVTYTIMFEMDGQTTEIKGTETWKLTKEGALSLVTVSSSSFGDFTMKAMYEK